MCSAQKTTQTIRVCDVMSTDVVTIGNHDTMAEAAATLVENRIDGAPVVDEMGRCVGVITAGDFVRYAKLHGSNEESESLGYVHELLRDARTGNYQIETRKFDAIEGHMTVAVQTIDPQASLDWAAKIVTEEGIHRLIILDETERPVGVLTSNDMLRALL